MDDDARPVMVSHVENPTHFYCQSDTESLDSLTQLIDHLYGSSDKAAAMVLPAEFCKVGTISSSLFYSLSLRPHVSMTSYPPKLVDLP